MEKITKSSDKVLIDPNEPLILPDGTALVGRVEWFLYALCCLDYQNLPTPMSRIEEFANALITGEVPNIEPQSRAEQFFLAILDGNVSNLPQPQSRSEILLDKLARGEFDLSDVEPIQSRYELLLAYLIKNGGIGNIDYVLYEFSEAMKTMYNTVEKPFKSLELSGNTLVNCVLEDTENDDYTSFDKDYSGTSFTINGTSEGAIKSAILKGQTLVNLHETTFKPTVNNTFQSLSNHTVKLKVTQLSYNHLFYDFSNLKPNGKYAVVINVLENNLSRVDGDGVVFNSFAINYNVTNFENISFNNGEIGKKVFTFTMPNDIKSYSNSKFMGTPYNILADGGTISFNVAVFEVENFVNVDNLEYFEGMQSIKMPVLTSVGKNLFDRNQPPEQLIWGNNIKKANVNENTAYVYSSSPYTGYVSIKFYDNNDNEIGQGISIMSGTSFTTPPNTSYLKTHTSKDSLVQIEEGTQATSYEPYKSNILSCNEEVMLRGIGDVKDELNCLTGEVVKRIGEATFKGALNEGWGQFDNSAIQEKTCLFAYYGGLPSSPSKNLEMICDKYIIDKSGYSALLNTDEEMIHVYTDRAVYFRVSKSKLSSPNVSGFKEWLSQNPFTIQYKLATDFVKTVDLSVVDQDNTKIDKIHVFNETTHVNASSDELTPTVNISKSVSYPTIIKPNTKYTVDLKRNNKPLTVNLGGTEVTFADGETRKTITTPSTLVNDKLSYYGIGAKCNEIMLIEGEIERNIDYFTGMQSVVMQNQMPILHTTGKNLCGAMESGSLTQIEGEPAGHTSRIRTVDYIPIDGSYWISTETSTVLGLRYYDINKNCIGYPTVNTSTSPINVTNIPSGAKYLKFTVVDVTDVNYKIYLTKEQHTIGEYEPYKTSILSCNEEVTLRGIGDVKDGLNLLIGELTERIGEIVLDGSEDWRLNKPLGDGSFNQFVVNIVQAKKLVAQKVVCDKLVSETSEKNNNAIWIYDGTTIVIHLSCGSVDELKQWLSQNPITVQYELATPVVTTIDLSVVDQDGNVIPKVKSYKDVTHLEVTVPKQSLLPNISAEVATDNSKDMSSLAEKHQEISEAQSAIQNSIQSQSDEIDTAMMATTEIFESILE